MKENNMTLKDKARQYYLNDYNCAEAMLRAINDVYGLNLPEGSLLTASGFGGGMGCEKACGALCGGIAALGPLLVQDRAHATQGFGERCAALVQAFERDLGSDLCADLKPRYKTEESRCLKTVELAADSFEREMEAAGIRPKG